MRIVILVLSVIVFSGCTQYKKIVYLQSDADNQKVTAMEAYVLRTGDLLHVRVSSQNSGVGEMFNIDSENSRVNYNDVSLYLSGFQLDENHCIELPIVGQIDLTNKTLSDARKIISDSVNSYINDAIVNVKLLSYRITVLGEVESTGLFTVYRNHSTIFDVLSLAGDITTLGNRTDVEVLRQSGNEKVRLHIDLTQLDALNNPAYYIYPNDIIYVKPLKAKIFRDNIPIISLTLTTITTFLLILNYIK